MKTIKEIVNNKINIDSMEKTSKDFVINKYKSAKAQMFNYRWFVVNQTNTLGVGSTEDEAWDNAAERMLFV